MPNYKAGVFPANKKSRHGTKSVAFVFNTQDNSLPEQHRVDVYVNPNGLGVFFDSYGLPQYIANHVRQIRNKKSKVGIILQKVSLNTLKNIVNSMNYKFELLHSETDYLYLCYKKIH